MAETGTTILTPALLEITTAGTAQQLPTSGATFAAKAVIIQALATNEEPVVVGDKNVKAKAGSHGAAEVRGIELKKETSITLEISDATQVWVDARKSKDGVSYLLILA